jgi:hypothetical protein
VPGIFVISYYCDEFYKSVTFSEILSHPCVFQREDVGYLLVSGKIAPSSRQIEDPRAFRKDTISPCGIDPKALAGVQRPSDLSKRVAELDWCE